MSAEFLPERPYFIKVALQKYSMFLSEAGIKNFTNLMGAKTD